MDWLTTILNSSAVTDTIGAVRDIQVSKNDALKQQQLGAGGWYTHGQFDANQAGLGISPTLLLIGGAVLLFVFLKD